MSPDFGATASTVEVAAAPMPFTIVVFCEPAVADGAVGCSWKICLQIEEMEDRLSLLVSKASRTRITSKGYVKKTDVAPARDPLSSRLTGVS